MSGLSEEQRTRNEMIFRDANERIRRVREGLPEATAKTPFVCECGDPTCREIVRLDLDEYEAVRSSSLRFLVAPGHPTGGAPVVGEAGGYRVIEKADHPGAPEGG